MYLSDGKNDYEISNEVEFQKNLDENDLEYISNLFKSTYMSKKIQDMLDDMVEMGILMFSGEPISYNDTMKYLKNYISLRFGKNAFDNLIESWDSDFAENLVNADK